MHTTAHDLIARFKGHPEPRVRCNCSAALAALARAGDSRCVQALADFVVDDPHEEVRAQVEGDILSLAEPDQRRVALALIERGRTTRETEATAVYRAIGRLRVMGLPMPTADRSIAARLRQPGSPRATHWRARLVPATIGAVLGFVLVAILVRAWTPETGGNEYFTRQAYVELFLVTVLPAALCVPLALRRQQSILLEWDETAVVSRDVAEAFVLVGVLAWIAATVLLDYLAFDFTDAARFGVAIGLAYAAAAAAAVAFGAMASRAWVQPRLRRIGHVLSAFAAGFITLTGALLFTRTIIGGDYELRLQHEAVAQGAWLLAIPMLSALAWAAAVIDVIDFDAPPELVSRGNRLVSVAMMTSLAALGVVAFLWDARPGQRPIESSTRRGDSANVDRSLSRTASQLFPLRIDFPQRVSVSVIREPGTYESYVVALLQIRTGSNADDPCPQTAAAGNDVVFEDYSGTDFSTKLPGGCYAVRVDPIHSGNSDRFQLEQAIDLLAQTKLKSSRPDTLRVGLNQDKTRFLQPAERVTDDSSSVSMVVTPAQEGIRMTFKNPTFVTASIAAVGARFSSSAPTGAPLLSFQRGPQRSSGSELSMRFERGEHVVPIDFNTAQAASVFFEFVRLEDDQVLSAYGAREIRIALVPYNTHLELAERTLVRAEAINEVVDLQLVLFDGSAKELAKADEPELVERVLAPGKYRLRTELYGDPNKESLIGVQLLRIELMDPDARPSGVRNPR